MTINFKKNTLSAVLVTKDGERYGAYVNLEDGLTEEAVNEFFEHTKHTLKQLRLLKGNEDI